MPFTSSEAISVFPTPVSDGHDTPAPPPIDWDKASFDQLKAGYIDMVADRERELEAADWSEALIGDSLEAR